MKTKVKIIITFSIIMSALLSIIVWTAWGNTALELNHLTIKNNRLPKAFNGYRIAHVSDLHNTQIGENNETLLTMLRNAKPNIIAITGDLIDSRNTNIDIAIQFIHDAMKIAPCYYVTGNHEARVKEYGELKTKMSDSGVIILEDTSTKIDISGDTITLIGVDDPSFHTDNMFDDSEMVMQSKLMKLHSDEECFTILLSHRPELFENYVDHNIDLILSGHAHGGQFRLPLIGGIVAPNQGLFPKFDAGIYTDGNTNMIVSRGIGNSILPLRINNRPEIILIKLKSNTY